MGIRIGEEDDAIRAVSEGQDLDLDEVSNKRILRKIDRHILPLMCVIYGLNYLDKTTLSYAGVMGMQPDIRLTGREFSLLGSIFYVGYIAWEYPTSRLLQRLPLAKYSALNIIAWGITLTCFAAVRSFAEAATNRFFLGVFEATVTPGFALFTSQWYTKREQGTRTGIWFGCNGLAAVAGGLISYVIAVDSRLHPRAIAPWRILFLATGIFTVAVGVLFFFLMPDNQWNARFLNKSERSLAVERIRINQQGIGNKIFKWYQVREALTDPMTWAFTIFSLAANIPNGGIAIFFSQLIVSFGYSPEQSLLYGTPGGAIQCIALVTCGYYGDRFMNRIAMSSISLMIGILGVFLLVFLPLDNHVGRLFGFYLSQASPTAFVTLLSLISTNVAGYTKKTTVAALFMMAYCLGNMLGPQAFRPKDAPYYMPAIVFILFCWGICFLDLIFIVGYYKRQNRLKSARRSAPGYVRMENVEFMDLTDMENHELEYTI